MQDKKETGTAATEPNNETENRIAQNPNPRANDNIRNTTFDRNDSSDQTPDVGSEITDGNAG